MDLNIFDALKIKEPKWITDIKNATVNKTTVANTQVSNESNTVTKGIDNIMAKVDSFFKSFFGAFKKDVIEFVAVVLGLFIVFKLLEGKR